MAESHKPNHDYHIPLSLASFLAHAGLFALSLLLAFAVVYNFRPSHRWFTTEYLTYLPLTLVVKLSVFGWFGLYRDSWRYVGLRDLFRIIIAVWVSIFFCVAIYYFSQGLWRQFLPPDRSLWVPNSVFMLDWVFSIAVVASARVGYRFYYEELRPLAPTAQIRLLIVGAGDTGDLILREIARSAEARYEVVGFLDDDERKWGGRIRGVEVLGPTEEIRKVCQDEMVDEVLLAMPSAPQRKIRHLVELCQGMNLRFRTVPSVRDLIEGRVEVNQIRPVDIEDLLGRDPVTLDTTAIGQYIHSKVVLVSGAGGSIGAEMCRQIARFQPKRLLLVERMENALFEIHRELVSLFPDLDIQPCVADIGDAQRIRTLLAAERPAAIFHAAAHKHVPMMEWNPGEAVKNNILGTKCLADEARRSDVAKFVMISTDKAVNPTSVMGCTKRVAEMYVQQLASTSDSRTEFVTVRFGNVLGSSGSVIPIFKEQIAHGGPVTVTHPEMVRYFMTIPEAAQLVLQAGAMGKGGEIFLLDMGEPVKIVQLAQDLITLSGLRPYEDIDIVFTGVRPGEKLFEELSITGEDTSRTAHPKIGINNKRPEDFEHICRCIDRLIAMMDSALPEAIREELKKAVPEYDATPAAPPLHVAVTTGTGDQPATETLGPSTAPGT